MIRVPGKVAYAAVGVRTVRNPVDVRQSVQRGAVYSRTCEKISSDAFVTDACVVRGDVYSIGHDCHRFGEINLLPTGGTLSAESRASQQSAPTGPQVGCMYARIAHAFVKPNARDVAIAVGFESYSKF